MSNDSGGPSRYAPQPSGLRGVVLGALTCCLLAWGCATPNTATDMPTPATTSDDRPTTRLVYVYDALCGWCYGFSPVLGALRERHPGMPIDVVSGGMIRGDRRGPIGEVAGYIKWAYKDVERATGVRFGESFFRGPLEAGDMYMTSEPPAALLAYVREAAPQRQYDGAHALQTGIYYHGFGPGSDELARHLAEATGLPPEAVVAARDDARYQRLAEGDFGLTAKLGVRGFPALFAQVGDSLHVLANGYRPLAEVSAALDRALAAAEAPGR